MPNSYRVDVDQRVVVSRVWGVVTTNEIHDHYRAIQIDPGFEPGFSHLVDIRGVTAVRADAHVIRTRGTSDVFARGAMHAIVAPPGFLYGIARMFASSAEAEGQVVSIFEAPELAEAWLGVAPGTTAE